MLMFYHRLGKVGSIGYRIAFAGVRHEKISHSTLFLIYFENKMRGLGLGMFCVSKAPLGKAPRYL